MAKRINPRARYTMRDIVDEQMFWWATSYPSVRKRVERDLAGRNILKTVVVGEGRLKRYHFRGTNIKRFIKAFQEGKVN